MKILGVDISEMNGSVDFAALKAAGVKFAIIRTGYGSDYPSQQDKRFNENVRKAEASGIPWGAYHYGYAKDAAGGKAEARHCLRILNGRVPRYGVWYDMEDATTLAGNLASAAAAFCAELEAAGLYVGIYANASWWKNYLTNPVFNRWDKWVAQYNNVLQYGTPGGNVGMWQYTDKLTIGGKAFDGDWAYKDYPKLTKEEETVTYEDWLAFQKRYERELAAKRESEWAKPAIAYCKENNIMVGDNTGDFDPLSMISRQEVAQVAMRLDQRAKEGK